VSYSYTVSKNIFISVKQKMMFRSKNQMRFCTNRLLLGSILRRKVASGSLTNAFQYTAREFDAETSLTGT